MSRYARLTYDKRHWEPSSLYYDDVLELVGAHVLAFESFGDYQGTWLAIVEWKGKRHLIKDYYGSCSGCDAIQDELGYGCQFDTEEEVLQKIKDFGARYLDDFTSLKKVREDLADSAYWDLESTEILKWLDKHSYLLTEELSGTA